MPPITPTIVIYACRLGLCFCRYRYNSIMGAFSLSLPSNLIAFPANPLPLETACRVYKLQLRHECTHLLLHSEQIDITLLSELTFKFSFPRAYPTVSLWRLLFFWFINEELNFMFLRQMQLRDCVGRKKRDKNIKVYVGPGMFMSTEIWYVVFVSKLLALLKSSSCQVQKEGCLRS